MGDGPPDRGRCRRPDRYPPTSAGFGMSSGFHQALDELHRAVLADGDDAPRHGEIFAAEDSTRLDGALDLVEAGLDGLGFGQQLFRPPIVVDLGEFGLAGLQLPDLGLLLIGWRAGLRLDAAVAGGVVPGDLDHRRGPLPPGRQLVGGRLELARGELCQQHRVLEPDAALVVPGEQVAQHGAAGGLVGLDPDEPGDRRGARHALLGEQPLHLPGRRPVALCRDLFPDRHLALAVGGDGEGLQHFEVDPVGPVGVEQLRRGVAEAQALLDQPLREAEARRDGRDRLPGLHQLREGDHLVGGVHGDSHDILGERDFSGIGIPGSDLAGHGMVGIDHAVLDQRLHGLQATPAGDHGVAVGAVFVGSIDSDDEVLQQAEGGDRGLELGVGPGIGRRLADVLGGEREQAQRDLPDERFGPGGDEVHASLREGLHRRGGHDSRLLPRACPPPGPARPPRDARDRRRGYRRFRWGVAGSVGRRCSRQTPVPWNASAFAPRRGRLQISRPRGRPYDGRPGGLRTGSPPSPPPRSIRPTVRRLPRSPRLSGPGPHPARSVRPPRRRDRPVGAGCRCPAVRRPARGEGFGRDGGRVHNTKTTSGAKM